MAGSMPSTVRPGRASPTTPTQPSPRGGRKTAASSNAASEAVRPRATPKPPSGEVAVAGGGSAAGGEGGGLWDLGFAMQKLNLRFRRRPRSAPQPSPRGEFSFGAIKSKASTAAKKQKPQTTNPGLQATGLIGCHAPRTACGPGLPLRGRWRRSRQWGVVWPDENYKCTGWEGHEIRPDFQASQRQLPPPQPSPRGGRKGGSHNAKAARLWKEQAPLMGGPAGRGGLLRWGVGSRLWDGSLRCKRRSFGFCRAHNPHPNPPPGEGVLLRCDQSKAFVVAKQEAPQAGFFFGTHHASGTAFPASPTGGRLIARQPDRSPNRLNKTKTAGHEVRVDPHST